MFYRMYVYIYICVCVCACVYVIGNFMQLLLYNLEKNHWLHPNFLSVQLSHPKKSI